jgi:hypothetical protein
MAHIKLGWMPWAAALVAALTPLAAQAATVPVNNTAPSVPAAQTEGVQTIGDPGGWSDSPSSYQYQWVRCDSDGASNCADITNATQRTYTPVAGDLGKTLELRVVATNSSGDSAPATSAASQVVAAPAAAATVPSANLLRNPGAEEGACASSTGTTESIPGWTTTGTFTALCYSSGQTLDPSATTAANGANAYFMGGVSTPTTATQTVSVADAALQIDSGAVGVSLNAWLGGYAEQDDNMTVTASFVDASDATIGGPVQIGPVLASDRGSASILVQRSATATVPAGTRAIVVTMVATRLAGSDNDGSADNVDLHLTSVGGGGGTTATPPPPPPPPTGVYTPPPSVPFTVPSSSLPNQYLGTTALKTGSGTVCTSTTVCVAGSNAKLGTCYTAVGGNPDLIFTGSCMHLASSTSGARAFTLPAGTQHPATVQLPAGPKYTSTASILADGIEFDPAQGATLTLAYHLIGPVEEYEIKGETSNVSFETVGLDRGAVDWVFVKSPSGGYTVYGARGADQSQGPWPVMQGSTFNSLSVASMSWPEFHGGKASFAVTSQLPATLGGATMSQPITITNGSVTKAVQAGFTARAADTQADADSAAGSCDTLLGGPLPSGPNAITLDFPAVDLGGIKLDGAQLIIDGWSTFTAKAAATLPFQDSDKGSAGLKAVLQIHDGSFYYGCASAAFSTPLQIGSTPVFLKHIALGVLLNNGVMVAGNTGLLIGENAPVLDTPPVDADPINALVVIPAAGSGQPWGLHVDGKAKVLGVADVAASVTYYAIPYVRASVELQNVPIGPVELKDASLSYTMDPHGWIFAADTDMGWPYIGDVNGELAISNLGIGACGTTSVLGGDVTVGVAYRWNDGLSGLVSDIAWGSCNIANIEPPIEPTCEDLQTAINALKAIFPAAVASLQQALDAKQCYDIKTSVSRSATARAAAKPPALRYPIAPGNAEAMQVGATGGRQWTFRGAGDAPVVTLVSPDKKVVTGPALRDARSGTTIISVPHAAKGAWTIYVDPSSVPVTAATTAGLRPTAKVTGSVAAVRGSRERVLRYRISGGAGQAVAFREAGPTGGGLIGRAKGTHGSLRFTPAAGAAEKRTIEAVVSTKGVPVTTEAVTTYSAPKPALSAPPRGLRITRHGIGVTARWHANGRAPGGYLVTVKVSDGRHWVQRVHRGAPLHATVDKLGFGKWRIAIAVAGVDRAGRPGKPARAKMQFVRRAPRALRHL